jgi:hypothetical protein
LIINNTAHSGLDFILPEKTLTFTPTSSSHSLMNFTVNIIDDDVIEIEERFKLRLTTSQPGVDIGPQNETEFLICNDDGM